VALAFSGWAPIFVGFTNNQTITASTTNCYGQSSGSWADDPSWTDANASIAYALHSTAYGVSVGDSSSTTFWTFYNNYQMNQYSCNSQSYNLQNTQPQQVVPLPTNFRQDGPGVDLGNGNLGFTYRWASSSGNLQDLGACQVGEYVTYPGSGNYTWASPPYFPGYSSYNPDISNASATLGVGNDVHTHASFATPYITNSFNAAQQFRWSCTNYANGQWFDFADYTIGRSVNQHTFNSSWYYTVTKAGASAQVDPLP
jgi:hypothetical protein